MISVIVCSADAVKQATFLDSLSSTIGVVYETIIIENRNGQMGICEAYNQGLQKASFDILCFCHEDIVFNTQGWGNLVMVILEDESVGLAGVGGALYKSKTPGSWATVPTEYYRNNIVQHGKDEIEETRTQKDNGIFSEVAVLDGCFIAGSKKTFERYPWNESHLKGFHLYDIDICVRAGKSFKIVVIAGMTITHQSEGKMDKSWLEASERYHKQYASLLPASVAALKKKEKDQLEFYAHYRYVVLLIQFKRPLIKVFSTIIKGFIVAPGKRENFSLFKQAFRSRL